MWNIASERINVSPLSEGVSGDRERVYIGTPLIYCRGGGAGLPLERIVTLLYMKSMFFSEVTQ